jgi:hypothetical protein
VTKNTEKQNDKQEAKTKRKKEQSRGGRTRKNISVVPEEDRTPVKKQPKTGRQREEQAEGNTTKSRVDVP